MEFSITTLTQTWNNVQACKQCLCKFSVFGVKFQYDPTFYIENAQKRLCKSNYENFACVNDKQYSMSEIPLGLAVLG